jgi:hypothetical protein
MRLKNEHVRSEPLRIEETKPEKRLKGGFQDGKEKQRRQNDFS